MAWTESNIPDQCGKTAIVTGSNTGVGFETARALTQKNAHVILACRNEQKGNDAARRIRDGFPDAKVEVMTLDLSSLASIRSFSESVLRKHEKLDLLINNAGVMTPPHGETTDGFELQFGTNYLGHFALTGLLIDRINMTPASRIIPVSSIAHYQGKIDFNNLNAERSYRRYRAYAQSKLAVLIFAYELQRRLEKSGSKTLSIPSHPGVTRSELVRHSLALQLLEKVISQDTPLGALPLLRAAVDPQARGGEYYGPGGLSKMRGNAQPGGSSRRSRDERVAERLWQVSEELTAVRYLS